MNEEIGYINISITKDDVLYDSEFSLDQVIFWLEITKAMIIKGVLNADLPAPVE